MEDLSVQGRAYVVFRQHDNAAETRARLHDPLPKPSPSRTGMIARIEDHVRAFRDRIEPCWGPDTGAYSDDLVSHPGQPHPLASAGQCVENIRRAAARELRAVFPREEFRASVGTVHLGERAAIVHHTYLTYYPDLGEPPIVIDATADQSPLIDDPVISQICVSSPSPARNT